MRQATTRKRRGRGPEEHRGPIAGRGFVVPEAGRREAPSTAGHDFGRLAVGPQDAGGTGPWFQPAAAAAGGVIQARGRNKCWSKRGCTGKVLYRCQHSHNCSGKSFESDATGDCRDL